MEYIADETQGGASSYSYLARYIGLLLIAPGLCAGKSPGVLFTFPSQYYALSVTKEYLALEGGPSDFPQGSSCLVVLWILPLPIAFMYGAFTLSGRSFQDRSINKSAHFCSP